MTTKDSHVAVLHVAISQPGEDILVAGRQPDGTALNLLSHHLGGLRLGGALSPAPPGGILTTCPTIWVVQVGFGSTLAILFKCFCVLDYRLLPHYLFQQGDHPNQHHHHRLEDLHILPLDDLVVFRGRRIVNLSLEMEISSPSLRLTCAVSMLGCK